MDKLTRLFPILLTVLRLPVPGVKSTTFTLLNRCDYTVWPGILSKSNAGVVPLQTTGFALQTGESKTITAPPSWSGTFWGRTLCAQDSAGNFSCATGHGGSGELECAGSRARPPATLAEFALHGAGGLDFYDVSLLDGYNLPIMVEASGGSGYCATTGCVSGVNSRCPSELKVVDGKRSVIACKSSCDAFGTPQHCCSGAYTSRDACKPSNYSVVFRSWCPRAYSYAYDDETSDFSCASADYIITFCPSLKIGPSTSPASSAYSLCSNSPYKCGELANLYYPFWGDEQRPPFCGGGDEFSLTCEDDQYPSIQIGSQIFEVRAINTKAYTMTMVPAVPLTEGPDVCSPKFNFSLSPLFRYDQTVHNITVFSDCPLGVPLIGGNSFTCDDVDHVVYYAGAEDEVLKQHPDLEKCGRRIQVPAEAVFEKPNGGDGGVAALNGAFGKGFDVSYTISQDCTRCLGSKGACGSNDRHEFTFYCPDGSNAPDCSGHQ